MSSFPGAPRLVKGGIVLIDPDSGAVQRIITLQYNPDTLTRTLQVKGTSGEGGDRAEALRLTGPPAETIKLDAEIDATDQLEFPDQNQNAVQITYSLSLEQVNLIIKGLEHLPFREAGPFMFGIRDHANDTITRELAAFESARLAAETAPQAAEVES